MTVNKYNCGFNNLNCSENGDVGDNVKNLINYNIVIFF